MQIDVDYPWSDQKSIKVWVRPGWRRLVLKLVVDIDIVLRGTPAAQVHFNDVKEKMGVLRIYYRTADMRHDQEDKLETLTRRASEASASICDICGGPGMLRGDGGAWRVRCDDHEKVY